MNRTVRIALMLIAAAGLVWVSVKVLYNEVPRSRIAANELWSASDELRRSVESAAKQKTSITEAMNLVQLPTTLATPSGNATVAAASDGQLVLQNQAHGVTITLKKVMRDGSIHWHCSGTPAAAVPLPCRENR